MAKKRMVHVFAVLRALATAAALVGAAAAQGQALGGGAAPVPAGDATKGQQLFTNDGCYQCHGRVAQGGASGPHLAPRPLPFAAVVQYVRRPTGLMPPYTVKTISDQELADLYAFLGTIPEPPAVASLPLLHQ
jgi:mono/diheme cytochrome c family protein